MAGIVRIDDEVITTDDFIRTLKLSEQFEGLVEQMVRDPLMARGTDAGKPCSLAQPATV